MLYRCYSYVYEGVAQSANFAEHTEVYLRFRSEKLSIEVTGAGVEDKIIRVNNKTENRSISFGYTLSAPFHLNHKLYSDLAMLISGDRIRLIIKMDVSVDADGNEEHPSVASIQLQNLSLPREITLHEPLSAGKFKETIIKAKRFVI